MNDISQNDISSLPDYIISLTDGLEELGYGEDFHIPASFDDLKHMAPDLAELVGARPEAERTLIFRCLGEAQAALLFEQYDALVGGRPLSQSKKRGIFLCSFKTRLRSGLGQPSP